MGTLWGYARVSTAERPGGQNLDLQIRALREAGVRPEHLIEERASGSRAVRPAQQMLLEAVQPGDEVLVYSVSRWSRSTHHLLSTVEALDGRGVAFRSLTESAVSTRDAHGRLLLGLLAVLAAWERDVIVERTRDGLAAARARGKRGGRPPALNATQVRTAKQLRGSGMSVQRIADSLRVSRPTVYKALAQAD